jgi:hypothetical protein
MMKALIRSCLVGALWLMPAAQNSSVDLEKERGELLKLHQQDRQAHFQTSADLLLSHHPVDGFISVSQGKISRLARAESRKRFETYFKDAKYYEWDDLEMPIIRISNDGSMAWMIVRLKVRRAQKNSSGAEREEKFVYSGIMTYEKKEGKWLKVANVSTFE